MQVFCATPMAWSYNVHEDTVVQCLFTRKLFRKRQTAVVCTAKDSMNTVFKFLMLSTGMCSRLNVNTWAMFAQRLMSRVPEIKETSRSRFPCCWCTRVWCTSAQKLFESSQGDVFHIDYTTKGNKMFYNNNNTVFHVISQRISESQKESERMHVSLLFQRSFP